MIMTDITKDKDVVLKIEGLHKQIGDLKILTDINASLVQGHITAFVGPNGAGKTSLFHAVTGNMRSDTGRVFLNGNDITHFASWKIAELGIGRVFQDVRVFPHLSAVENVVAALQSAKSKGVVRGMIRGTGGEMAVAWKEEAEDLLSKLGVEGDWYRPAKELSWGNQKLLAFARLQAGNFSIALLDEPVAGVSRGNAAHIADLIRDLVKNRNMTIALIEHDTSFVHELADDVYLMNEGKIIDYGVTAKVLSKPENRELCLGL